MRGKNNAFSLLKRALAVKACGTLWTTEERRLEPTPISSRKGTKREEKANEEGVLFFYWDDTINEWISMRQKYCESPIGGSIWVQLARVASYFEHKGLCVHVLFYSMTIPVILMHPVNSHIHSRPPHASDYERINLVMCIEAGWGSFLSWDESEYLQCVWFWPVASLLQVSVLG